MFQQFSRNKMRKLRNPVAIRLTNDLWKKARSEVCTVSLPSLPFCLSIDRLLWTKCIHSSIFPLCIQSNMSPPLTEDTGIGCIMMGTRRPPSSVTTDRNCKGSKINSWEAALQHHKVKWEGISCIATKQPTSFIVSNWLRQSTPWTPHWLQGVTWPRFAQSTWSL